VQEFLDERRLRGDDSPGVPEPSDRYQANNGYSSHGRILRAKAIAAGDGTRRGSKWLRENTIFV
jgi:hypothetical protein